MLAISLPSALRKTRRWKIVGCCEIGDLDLRPSAICSGLASGNLNNIVTVDALTHAGSVAVGTVSPYAFKFASLD